MDTGFPPLKSVTKAPTNDTSYTSSALHNKRALLKNVITLTKNNEYQILGATAITYNDGTIRRTLSRVEICDEYNRGNVITMSQPKIITVNETKINCVTIKNILTPQLCKGVIMQHSNSTEKQPQEKKEELPQHIDEKSSAKTGFEFFRHFTFKFLNISILCKYILKNCQLRFVFPSNLNLCILGLQITNILLRSILYFALFNFLCSHFVLVSKRKIHLNFFKYDATTRIDSSDNIKFYEYYYGNYDTLRKDFDLKNRVVLHTKIELNLHLVKRTYRAVNFLNVSETETYWINLIVIGLLIAKVFLKHNINIFVHIFFIQLFSSLSTIYWSVKNFSPVK